MWSNKLFTIYKLGCYDVILYIICVNASAKMARKRRLLKFMRLADLKRHHMYNDNRRGIYL
jgi:hypothetical protein